MFILSSNFIVSLYLLFGGIRLFVILPNILLFYFMLPKVLSFRPTRSDTLLLISSLAGFFGSLLSLKPLLSCAFVFFITIAYFSIDKLISFVKLRNIILILNLTCLFNIIVAFIQIGYPSFILAEPFRSYTIPYHSNINTFFEFFSLPTLHLLPRLSGIFVENGPMVTSILIITFLLDKIKKAYKSLYLGFFPIYQRKFFDVIQVCNIVLIIFTGSKLTLVYLPFLLFILLRRFDFVPNKFTKISLVVLIFTIPSSFSLISSFLLNSSVFYDIFFLMGGLFDRLLIPQLSFFVGTGILSSTNDLIMPSLNGIFIYSLSFGLVFGLIFVVFNALYILYPYTDPFIVLLFFISLITSGSFLSYHFILLLIASRISFALRDLTYFKYPQLL